MAFAEVNGAAIYYEMRGTGTSLLFVHAGLADSRMWDAQMAAFEGSHQVIRFDMRGFGRSNLPPGSFKNVDDVRGLMDALKLDTTTLVGSSFGSLVALDFALEHPDRVTGLVLAAPSVSGTIPSQRIRQFWDEEESAIERGDFETATELNLSFWVDGPERTADQVSPPVRELVRRMQLAIFEIPVPESVEALPISQPAIERLPSLQVPVLVIVGALDLEEKIALARRLAGEVPTARLVVVDSAAHMVNMEKSAAFNLALVNFFRVHRL